MMHGPTHVKKAKQNIHTGVKLFFYILLFTSNKAASISNTQYHTLFQDM